jgi:hypothetical protein
MRCLGRTVGAQVGQVGRQQEMVQRPHGPRLSRRLTRMQQLNQ